MSGAEMRMRQDGYEIRYAYGRLADVYFGGEPMETVQVRDYDFATGEFGPEPTRGRIKLLVRNFLEEAGGPAIYWENHPNPVLRRAR